MDTKQSLEKEAGRYINQHWDGATSHGFQLGAGLLPMGRLAKSGGIFGC